MKIFFSKKKAAILGIVLFLFHIMSLTATAWDNNWDEQISMANSAIIETFSSLDDNPAFIVEELNWPDNNVTEKNSDNPTKAFIEIFQGHWPMLNNPELNEVAGEICQATLSNGVGASHAVISDVPLSEDYMAKKAEISSNGIIIQEFMDPLTAAEILFSNLLSSAYDSYLYSGNATLMLDNDFVEFGAKLCSGITSISKGLKANAYILSVVFARPAGPQPFWVQCGHVYNDKNGNGQFDPGEGLERVLISTDENPSLNMSGFDGKYCIKHPTGQLTLYLHGYPFVQSYIPYYKTGKLEDGILIEDYRLHLTQEMVDSLLQEGGNDI